MRAKLLAMASLLYLHTISLESACAASSTTPDALCHHLTEMNIPAATRQVAVVDVIQGFHARVVACQRQSQWHAVLFTQSVPAVIGRAGLAPSGAKKEGDWKTPAGLFPIRWTFGTEPLALKMDYRYITAEDKWIDDPHHPNYNSWVTGATTAKSYELMRIPLYRWGAVVDYNTNPTVAGLGSAIFVHLWRSSHQGTAGCVAMSKTHLLALLHWLDKQDHPLIYINTNR